MQKKQKVTFNILFVIISLIVSLFMMPERREYFDTNSNFILSLLCLVNIIVFWRTTTKDYSSWIRYDTLFLLGFVIVHFQIPFLASIGVEPTDPSFVWINKKVVNYATWLSTVVLLLWILGFLFYMNRKKIIKKAIDYKVNTQKIDYLLIIIFVLFIGLVGSEFLAGSYDGGDNWGVGATYAYLLLSVTLYLKIIYFFINHQDIKITKSNFMSIVMKNKAFVFILCFYVLIFLAAGDRGPVMEVGLLTIGAYSIYQRKIPLGAFVLMIFLGATLFTVISYGRSSDVTYRSGNILEQGYTNLQKSNSDFNPTDELATSTRILYRAIDVVPDSHPYLYGLTMFSDIVGVIPFGGSTYLQLTQLPDMYKSSSYFFTILGQGSFFEYGEGSEIIADIYINLGIYGVLILMFFFGYFISYLTFNAYSLKSHRLMLVYLLLIIGAIYINRSNFLDPLKIIFYGLLIDKFLVKKNYPIKKAV